MRTLTQFVSSVGVASALCAFMLLGNPISATAAVTSQDIEAQRTEVLKSMVGVLREEVKFLQLVLIDKLEDHVAFLQARLEAQK